MPDIDVELVSGDTSYGSFRLGIPLSDIFLETVDPVIETRQVIPVEGNEKVKSKVKHKKGKRGW